MILLTSKHQHINNDSVIYLDKSSVNLTSNMNMYIISDVELTSLLCKSSNSLFSLYEIQNGNISIVDSLTLSNVTLFERNNKYVYKLNVMFSSINEGIFDSLLTISTDQKTLTVKLVAEAEAIDTKLVVCLQNLKQFITDDYMIAFKDTIINASSTDTIVYNQKLHELLHNIFDLTAIHGTYKSLSTVLNFFGYGELLDLKEYWVSDNSYKSSSIKNSILTSIDKHLIGYKKTNQMSLVYQINTETGIDDDGLPIYSNVLDITDDILTKLYAIKRILETDFLFLNTHIVDIIGEFQTIASLELNVVLNDVSIVSTNLTSNLLSAVTYDFKHMSVFVERHDVILEPFSLDKAENNIDIERLSNTTISTQHDNFFTVKRIATEFEEFDYLTRYYSGNFGLIELKVVFDHLLYQSYKFVVVNTITNTISFTSLLYNIKDLSDDTILCGIKQLGTFKVIVYLIDWYGASTIISKPETITIMNRPIDIVLGKYGQSGSIKHDLSLYTTFTDTTGISSNIVVDNISETLDIMTWNPSTNTPAMQIARLYESDFDQFSTYTNLAQLNSIPLYELQGLPLTTWGGIYALAIFDILGNLEIGSRFIGLRNNATTDYDTIALEYDGLESSAIWLTKLITMINQYCIDNENSVFNNFTWTIQKYSDNEYGQFSDTRYMLSCRSKESSYNSRLIDSILSVFPNDDFLETYFLSDVQIFSRVDAFIQFAFIDTFIDTLTIKIGDVILTSESVELSSINDVKQTIDALLINSSHITVSVVDDTIIIYSKEKIKISHQSIGLHSDIERGLDISNILQIDLGSDIKLGEPFFAFIDSSKRLNLADTIWTLTNVLTNEIVTVQKSYAFRWIVSAKGSYSLTLSCKSNGQLLTTTKHGCIIVT